MARMRFGVRGLPLFDSVPRVGSRFLDSRIMCCAVSLAHAGDHVRAVADADQLSKSDKVPGGTLYDAACVYALSATAAQKDAKLTQKYAAQALALLRRAQTAGYFKDNKNVEHMKKDTDLDTIRGRQDYKSLLAELDKATSKESASKGKKP